MIKRLNLTYPILLALLFPLSVHAQVVKINFESDPQTISPNTLSEALTLQTQDSSGAAYQTPETIDLQFNSTSPTGGFFNSSGNPASTVMNKNTANKTFYYKDSSTGTFTLTVMAKGRESGETWHASQQIVVGSGGSINQDNGGQVLGATQDNDPSSSGLSATTGSSAPKYSTAASQLEVVAGLDRLSSPGSPLNFQALIKKNSVANEAVKFSWSFGDGATGFGPLVSHLYKYPGEYVVVLNATAGNNSAVSRLKVKVIEPKFSLSSAIGYVEVANNTDYEINLFNWKIISHGKAFIFQPDTIVLPHSSLKVDDSLFTIKGEEQGRTVLKNFLGAEVASLADPLSQTELKEASSKLEEARQTATALLSQLPNPRIETSQTPLPQLTIATTTPPLASDLGSTSLIYEIPAQKSFWQSLKQFLADLFR